MAGRVVSLAHYQHKAAEQHACPKARPDQRPNGEARFLVALQSKFRLQAHGVWRVHKVIRSCLQFYLRMQTRTAHPTFPYTAFLADSVSCMGCARAGVGRTERIRTYAKWACSVAVKGPNKT